MIEAQKLTKSFGNYKVLDDLNLKVEKGSVYGLLGPNGAGKTTLIKHLTGLYRQDQGTVSIADQPVYENPQVKGQMVYIPDDLYFFSQASIAETARFYAKIYPDWNWKRYEQLKQVFPIDSRRRVVKLSKGMQKQVAFWLGISSMPQVMILDEPVDGLDPVMRKKVWNLILQDVEERQISVLVSSHNLRELEDVCDHIGILHKGKIVVERELDDMKSEVHKFQLAFAGEIPEGFLEGPEVLHRTRTGSILLLIARGDKNELLQRMKAANPLILDVLPLTLEEIFIYELGGMGYDIQNIII
ncbi:ABC transporter ATP-binding protein [Desulfosporosinus youngiae]|uniref:ABC-type multidrug transport system, ATPase component n=1 Tax=Desulfosporosinus youngiae DSM 17734 TaxID=768710 RepID=H5Y4T0_9FIRM|nr:ABC transporter ATP-binding protein [Desulfosporosinus youngiae]EHQ89816.1 ABC-type multidrug transport system, ATPase component [Desulfosporosinus youngiae DSM 17734]